MKNTRLNMILNSIEALTLVDFNLLYDDVEFRKMFLNTFNDKNNDNQTIINKSVEYINNNY